MSRALIVMAKRPHAGSTKTRLTPGFTPEQAAALYSAMLADIVAVLGSRTDAELMIAADKPDSVAWFEETFPGVPIVLQRGATLGERLDGVLGEALERGHEAAFAISSDSPDLPEHYLTEAFNLLDSADVDVVLGPSEDGGYWTIGWQQRWTDMVVGVRMSRADVLANSVRIAEGLGARVAMAPEWYDIDEVVDVARLANDIDCERLPRITAALAEQHSANAAASPVPSSPVRGEAPPVSVVIPALNEADNIAAVVEGLLAEGVSHVVVVDNGSTDDTAERARHAGAEVVSEPRRGYGYACAKGTEAALRNGAEIVAYIDGDQSSRPNELASLVEPIVAGDARLVLGSRTAGTIAAGAMPPHQKAGNAATAALMRMLYRVPVTDLGPYRAIEAGLLRDLDMTEMTFGWPTEMMVKAAARKEPIVEVPVSWDNRVAGESKVGGTVIGSVLAGWHILRVTARHAWSARQVDSVSR